MAQAAGRTVNNTAAAAPPAPVTAAAPPPLPALGRPQPGGRPRRRGLEQGRPGQARPDS